jgi:murein DD-endopeptidase MepM/ murein hydrolase activator NlpD
MYPQRGGSPLPFAILLVLIVVGGLVFWNQRDPQTRVSTWGAQAIAPAALSAARSPAGLSGVAEQRQQGRGLPGDLRPAGNPLQAANTVMTQGYGVGTHAPAEIWGAIDLAIDGDGDGAADPDGSWNAPVYATHAGVITVTPNSHPAGNHVWVANDQYRTGFAHLASFAVESGQTVQRGDLIGYVGSTGMSSGPHLDYQVWEMQGGVWVNVNPLGYDPLAGAQ